MNIIENNNLKISEFLENKRVVIVGPAMYLKDKKLGNLIDNYDIVIRLNKGHNMIEDKINFGSRTDILYHCVNQHEDNGGLITDKIYNEIKYIKFCYPILNTNDKSSFINGNLEDFNKINVNYLNKISIINKEKYLKLEKNITCRPNTGIISILDILDYNIKELWITGFTLFKDGYNNMYRNIIDGKKISESESYKIVLDRMKNAGYKNSHNQYEIWKYLKNIILNNKKVKLDEEFFLILNLDLTSYKNNYHELNNKSYEECFFHYLYNRNFSDMLDSNKLLIYNENYRLYKIYNKNKYDIDFNKLIYTFETNRELLYKDYIITLLGYTKNNHTNFYPWNRFLDVFKTIGYKCEWVELKNLKKNNEKRLFITWNEPTCKELIDNKLINKNDIIFQKLTSLGKYDDNVNWTDNPKEWYKNWNWTPYKMIEVYIDKGYNIYGFGCKTLLHDFPEKKRICEKLKNRIFWITWGGTPFNFNEIIDSKPILNNLDKEVTFVGSKWGKIGRGNIDAWEKYLTPLENSYDFLKYGGLDSRHISDADMKLVLSRSKICPIIHAPSWQAERGIQDRFYSVFLSGRFGVCDNLGAIDIFGEEIKHICCEDPKEYFEKTKYFFDKINEQEKYIKFIQNKIKEKYNFYIQWYNIMCGKQNF